ncbi:MAG: Hsp20/alpha crystallin family protein [Cyclobacteriaceae bacterium]|nr:Hsp20/alpha crystallin family protein [Cyclobacteriaceae bacterium]
MKLVRYNPADFVPRTFSSVLDRMLKDTLYNEEVEANFVPHVDIIENEKNYEIHFVAPGLKKEDFNLEVVEDHLVVSGERAFPKEEEGRKFLKVETNYGKFSRSFRLTDAIEKDKISASYVNGILVIDLPKAPEKKELKTVIKVK